MDGHVRTWWAAADGNMCMGRASVQPDDRLYATLIRVAGQAGRMDVALQMQDAMEAAGIAPTRVSALMVFTRSVMPSHPIPLHSIQACPPTMAFVLTAKRCHARQVGSSASALVSS